jgi:hypothetical protein
MSTLTNKTVAESYRDLLHTDNNNAGIPDAQSGGSPSYMHDGTGNPSPLGLTTHTLHLSGNMILAENGEFDIGSPTHRASKIHSNIISLNGTDLTYNPSQGTLRIGSKSINTQTEAETLITEGDIGQHGLSEIGEGSWTLPDGDYVGQVKIITTLGTATENSNTIISVTTFACGTQITFEPAPDCRQSITLVWGTDGWVVTGRSHHHETSDKGPIVT